VGVLLAHIHPLSAMLDIIHLSSNYTARTSPATTPSRTLSILPQEHEIHLCVGSAAPVAKGIVKWIEWKGAYLTI